MQKKGYISILPEGMLQNARFFLNTGWVITPNSSIFHCSACLPVSVISLPHSTSVLPAGRGRDMGSLHVALDTTGPSNRPQWKSDPQWTRVTRPSSAQVCRGLWPHPHTYLGTVPFFPLTTLSVGSGGCRD